MLLSIKLLLGLGVGLFFIITLFVFYCFVSNRVDPSLVRIYLTFVSFIGGYLDVHFIDDSHPQGKRILAEKWKGQALEYLLATPTWFPLINVESVDGPVWERLRGLTLKILKTTDFKNRMPGIIEHVVQSFEPETRITNNILAQMNVMVVWELLFTKQPSMQIVTDVVQLIENLRGTIALKTATTEAGQQLKMDTINVILEHSKKIAPLREILEESEHEIELACAILQPFFISPGINISDIFSPMVQKAQNAPCLRACMQDIEMAKKLVIESIFMKHPFPILERDLTKRIGPFRQGSHVFIMNIEANYKGEEYCPARWGDSKFYRENFWKVFGCGPRGCVGAQLAMVWLPELLVSMHNRFGFDNIVPWEGHKFSGRTNDKDDNAYETLRRMVQAISYRVQSLVGLRKAWFHEAHLPS